MDDVVGTRAADGPRGYAIAYLTDVVIDEEIIAYIEQIEGTFAPFGGEWLVHGTRPVVVEGEASGDIVIIGFPSPDAAEQWYRSAEYQKLVGLRARRSRSTVALLSGVPENYRATDTADKLRATESRRETSAGHR
jgi:uncharacterized protein (DUF1330 family)